MIKPKIKKCKKDGKLVVCPLVSVRYKDLTSHEKDLRRMAREWCASQNRKIRILSEAPKGAEYYTLSRNYYRQFTAFNSILLKVYDPLSKSWKVCGYHPWDALIEIPYYAKKV